MRWLRYPLIAVLVLLASWAVVARGLPSWRARPIRSVMEMYLRAAQARDSSALEQMSASSYPVHWVLNVERQVPALIDAAQHAYPDWVSSGQETLTVSFRLSHAIPDPACYYRSLDNVRARFIRGVDGTWRVMSIAVPAC